VAGLLGTSPDAGTCEARRRVGIDPSAIRNPAACRAGRGCSEEAARGVSSRSRLAGAACALPIESSQKL
jgi:hypothetical protein